MQKSTANGLAIAALLISIVAMAMSGAAFYMVTKKTAQNLMVAAKSVSLKPPAVEVPAPPLALSAATAKMMEDRPIGLDTAPMTVIEYASMSCSHCAAFNNNVLPAVKKELVETGKIRMIYRDYPFDKFALKAAMLSRCAPPEKYHDVVDMIFKEQAVWTKSAEPLKDLTGIALRFGMSAADIETCLGNAELEGAILAAMQEAQKTLNVRRTPSFYFKKGDVWQDSYPEFSDIVSKNTKHEHEHGHKH